MKYRPVLFTEEPREQFDYHEAQKEHGNGADHPENEGYEEHFGFEPIDPERLKSEQEEENEQAEQHAGDHSSAGRLFKGIGTFQEQSHVSKNRKMRLVRVACFSI